MADTIYALSSGTPPSGIAIIRVSGPGAGKALVSLAGRLSQPRRATLRLLRDPHDNAPLDRALVLWLPGPGTATGEDLAEFHCHGGRAVVQAVQGALARMADLRLALPGEFTRRAFDNGRIDLNGVEGLSDLIAAETEQQRRAALAMADGHFSQRIGRWRSDLLRLSAMAEAALDFSDEDDVPDADIEQQIGASIVILADDVRGQLAAPSAERLRDGVRVVLAGPPNAGKSTLLNALVGREAAIVSDIAGTTRDRIEAPMAIAGVPFLFTDTAGLRNGGTDRIEAIGIDRARAALATADLILWLGAASDAPRTDAIMISAQCDRRDAGAAEGLRLSALTGEGMGDLINVLLDRARALLPGESEYALHERQRIAVAAIASHLDAAARAREMLIVAEELRGARGAIDRLTGQAGTEDMLDQLFSGFCIGK